MPELNSDLKRATRDRWLMGVWGGIAHEYGWSPRLVRLATVILAVALPGPGTTLALLGYVVLGMLLPKSEEF
jgi:phage shock protein PspC (stress-responsive transcriptional regulator)